MQTKRCIVLLAAAMALVLLCTGALAQEEYRTLKIGSEGKDVTRLKKAMYWLGYFTSDNVSDSYNRVTSERVMQLQKNNGLEETGIATPELQELIFSGNCIGTDIAPSPSPIPTPSPVPTPVPTPTPLPTPICPQLTPDLPPLNEQGFLPQDSTQDEYVYVNEDDGMWVYISKDISITIRRFYDKKEKNMWFEGDIYCTPSNPLKTYLNLTKSGKIGGGKNPIQFSKQEKIVLGLSDDHFGTRARGKTTVGVIVRNSQVFSDKTYAANKGRFPNLETLAVFQDGSMKTFVSDAYSAQEYIDMGAENVFAFGPILVRDGQVDPRLSGDYYHYREPRMALGMVEPYHYVLLAVNGRVEGQYKGVYLDWLAEKMLEMGAVEALNLDGGGTACLTFMGKRINRTGSDIRVLHSMIGFGNSDQVGAE